MLQVKELGQTFGGLQALRDVSFHIHEGEVVGLIGPNGAGKTTLFNLLTRVLPVRQGEIYFQKRGIHHLGSTHEICARGISRTFQVVKPFPAMTVYDNLFVAALRRHPAKRDAAEKVEAILDFLSLREQRDLMAGTLPLGHQKRIELGRALALEPKLLLLDELVGGLNTAEVAEMIEVVRQIMASGVTVLLIEHVMKVIMSLSQRIIVLDHGIKIVEGTPEEISTHPLVIQAYLGKEYAHYA